MRLGKTQKKVLRCLVEHGQFNRYHSGWIWDTRASTAKYMEQLTAKGLAEYSLERQTWTPTEAGRKAT